MSKKNAFLTIHGHFYQPPRENPWLESIELQDSALPYHDWNERIAHECYNANSVAKIVDNKNRILDIVNNYSLMSYNFGPTLMSWLEIHAPLTYERIIKADIESIHEFSGHGNAIAQVYNHVIMPLANYNDKITQVVWGIKDFEFRFGRKPEGMWLSETAVDDETLKVLVEHGIKFTILSPYQAEKFKKIDDKNFTDVSWGSIDPAKPYRYYIQSSKKGEYIDLFFYDGQISKSVAFDNILKDGAKFVDRLSDGFSLFRDYDDQLVNIATDGESYGHHTKFGDMALAYVLRVKAKDNNFKITNYGEYLDTHEVLHEVLIKQGSSWSCCHGVGRWKDDCGCSTGAKEGWNQKWRKPLREALDYLRDELIKLYENEGKKYFKSPWDARNAYIDVILDRNERSVNDFFNKVSITKLSQEQKIDAIKLLEMQRQTLLMYTSCGWFFADISGIETTQIMKYAARAMQLAANFTIKDYETDFLKILSQAKSNLIHFGNGANIYHKFVKPSVVTIKQIASLWAITSLYEDFEDDTTLYCYEIKRLNYKKVSKSNSNLLFGRLEICSKITFEKSDLIFALLQFPGGDFHCAIKEFSDMTDFCKIQKELTEIYLSLPLTEIIRKLDENFGKEYYTLKNLFIEERRKILNIMLQDKLNKFSNTYKEMYNEGKGSIYHLQSLQLDIPNEFKLAAGYTLSHEFNALIKSCETNIDYDNLQSAIEINNEAQKMNVKLDKKYAGDFFCEKIYKKVFKLANKLEIQRIENILELFNYIDKLDLKIDIAEAQNIYFNRIYKEIGVMIESIKDSGDIEMTRHFILLILELGEKLNITTEFYKIMLDKTTMAIEKIKQN